MQVESYIEKLKVLEDLKKYLDLLKVEVFTMEKEQAIKEIEMIESRLRDLQMM